ncbi:L-type lectin-domain containing receptor kinase IX.1-like [Rutidosis leptorrhynchoides]|uniref:L-type lectin-domain containing receptor kinase IX.1-like n=1 Tax=Rutidosis leptorrhynchoides TaxID=125765 RepID=UPI003A98FD46
MILLSCLLLFFPFSKSVSFEITTFANDATNIVYSGDAAPSDDGTIHFNDVNYFTRVGQAKYADPVHIWDKKSRKLTDFTTHFIFTVDTLNASIYGDGITFFLAPETFQIPPNSAAGFLGLVNRTYTDSPLNQMIFVEFDTFVNTEWDPPTGHVSINKNSLHSANYTAWNASIHSRQRTDAWITYNSTTKILDLIWGYGDENSSLSYQVDLREVVTEWVVIGFSAATGNYVEQHTLEYWKFDSSLNIVEKSNKDSKKWKLAVALSIPLGVLIIGGIIISCVKLSKRKRKTTPEKLETVSLTSMINDDFESGSAKRFSYGDLILATNNFSNDQKLGEGGFGCVYKGFLPCQAIAIAVKKISQGSKQGKKEFMTEVKINSSLRHRNLVQLLGWCHDETQFLLVYEYMPNGSLDSHLFGQKNGLKWDVRYKIAMGLASALLYLHEEWKQCVVHRDIKPSNIMLDSSFNVKLGDFGLARFMEHELGPQTTGLAGTLGYMAPEYITTGKASKESDVYSFGVVALEIACGRKVMDGSDWNFDLGLVKRVWDLYGKGELLSCVDPLLGDEYDVDEIECLMMVGLWCAHPDQSKRPSIRQAMQVLKFEGQLPNLPKNMPVAMYYSAPDIVPQFGSHAATMTNTSIDLAR